MASEPGGPAYDFRIGRYEARCDQYVEFLNDALANLDNARGQFLYFDIDSGDVYLHTAALGARGTAGDGTLIFSPSACRCVGFDAGAGAYVVTPGFESHPVTGVSWFGALKFCNWLTLRDGFLPEDRVYDEGPADDLAVWRPVSIAADAWAVRDLNVVERDALLARRGYRLPMDGGDGGTSPGPYNEWYKAAAHLGGAVHALYGFGRDALAPADANFRCSGDPFEDALDCLVGGTTPVGFFNGTNVLGDGVTPTSDTANFFGLYDASGNVWEWMQDQGFVAEDRGNRGGSWRSSAVSLRVANRAERSADAVNDATGFRLAQAVHQSLQVLPELEPTAGGVWGGPYGAGDTTQVAYTITNVTDQPVDFDVTVDVPWLILTLNPPTTPLAPGAAATATLVIAPACAERLPPGDPIGHMTVHNAATGTDVVRTARLHVVEPLAVTPDTGHAVGVLFGDSAPGTVYSIASASASTVEWSATWVDRSDPPAGGAWLTLNGASAVPSTPVTALQPGALFVGFATSGLAAGTYEADVLISDDCTGTVFTRRIVLVVRGPFLVTPVGVPPSSGGCVGPFTPATQTYTVESRVGQLVEWRVTLSPVPPDTQTEWLEVTPALGTLSTPGQTARVTLSFTDLANRQTVGEHSIALDFEALVAGQPTGFAVRRTVAIEVTDLVTPTTNTTFTGPLGDHFAPTDVVYQIQNTGVDGLAWTATFSEIPPAGESPTGIAWLEVSPAEGTILNPFGVAAVRVAPAAAAVTLPTGTYTGAVTFTLGDAATCLSVRFVTLVVGAPTFALDMARVPATDVQPFGPNYLYRIGRYEVTNDEYAAFLNDALRNPGNARGDFLTHYTTGGTVRLSGDATLLFDGAIGGAIQFDPAAFGGAGGYMVVAGKGTFPVRGVTWYGAAKFCNWMTVVQGMTVSDQRVYAEGPIAGDWFPRATTAAAYAGRDLTAAERATLVTAYRGFRLPMDDAADGASPYNEWYKAAAWLNATGTHATYGFGRNTLDAADALFRGGGNPYDGDPAPVGFFGVSALRRWDDPVFGWGFEPPSSFAVRGTSNGYGLCDMTGNLAEWVQDFGPSPAERGLRGGHFDNLSDSPFLTNRGRSFLAAGAASGNVGFRVAQSLIPVELFVAQDVLRSDGVIGGPYVPGRVNVSITNPGTQTLDGVSVGTDAAWLSVDGVPPQQVPPQATVVVPLIIGAGGTLPSAPAPPPGDFALVTAEDLQSGGPTHDYWIGRTEVTNAEFAVFLNDARANAGGSAADARSHHMYFDLDSGSVYINDRQAGGEGTAAPSSALTTLLYHAGIGRIHLVGGTFRVDPGYADHPAVGVTWYGALKYCNWLSVAQGFPAELLAYSEAPSPNLSGWRPVPADDLTWAPGLFDATRRDQLVRETFGYRLPMDEESTDASLHNEWYKAASFKGLDSTGVAMFDAAFGTGRDAPLTPADANFLASGDTPIDGTTAVRFFDGQHALFSEAGPCFLEIVTAPKTSDTGNGYRLYDACGNVAEWVQDFGATASERATRGGSWRDAAASALLTTLGRGSRAADVAADDVGFRVVRSAGQLAEVSVSEGVFDETRWSYLILHVDDPLTVTPHVPAALSWPYRGVPTVPAPQFLLGNRSATPMELLVTSDQPWLELTVAGAGLAPGAELEGTLASADTMPVELVPTASSTNLAPGNYSAEINVENVTAGRSESRRVDLTIDSPIALAPPDPTPLPFTGLPGGPFVAGAGTPDESPQVIVTLRNLSAYSLDYTVTCDQPWLRIEPFSQLTGTLTPAPAAIDFSIRTGPGAESLAIGDYSAVLRATFTDPANNSLTAGVDQVIDLSVRDWVGVDQAADPWVLSTSVAAVPLPTQTYTIRNDADHPIEVTACTDRAWVSLDRQIVEVFPGAAEDIVVSLNDEFRALRDGRHAANVVFENSETTVQHVRRIEVAIDEEFFVAPTGGLDASGMPGGLVLPPGTVFTLTNASDAAIDWRTDVQYAASGEPPWLVLNGAAGASGTLGFGGVATVVVRIDPNQAALLTAGDHLATLTFTDLTHAKSVARTARLALVNPQFALAEAVVPAVPAQPGGPAYSFLMATLHTTTADFVAFLNDALANPDNERGQYMFFDTATGDVYVNFTATGESGPDPGARTLKMFSPAVAGRIAFAAGRYDALVTPIDYSHHPVTGVSWFGALKYCNWLTLDRGMGAAERCYGEGSAWTPDAWRPVTISEAAWATRDLNDAERLELVARYRGFRLPMDDGAANANPSTDAPDAYNEWYKAAAWDRTARVNRAFGFGRDMLSLSGPTAGRDANYRCSGDPYENFADCTAGSTTPVGFYGGPHTDAAFASNPNENSFGLFDLCGNVYQWMQDRFGASAGAAAYRALRGGGWDDAATSANLRNTGRTFTAATATSRLVGLRVVRTPPAANADVDLDGDVDALDFTLMAAQFAGPAQTVPSAWATFDLDFDGDIDLADYSHFLELFGG
ncbi:MAG: SUMF1/EgtB/PvdO family nonheme iron enzyme [Planctomycetes bacterium]|nr:SUMF1/EgtB/PvdO family nonheme iron enzyme [Planctomycetota bacterium]